MRAKHAKGTRTRAFKKVGEGKSLRALIQRPFLGALDPVRVNCNALARAPCRLVCAPSTPRGGWDSRGFQPFDF